MTASILAWVLASARAGAPSPLVCSGPDDDACDQAIRALAGQLVVAGPEAPIERWRQLQAALFQRLLVEGGTDAERGCSSLPVPACAAGTEPPAVAARTVTVEVLERKGRPARGRTVWRILGPAGCAHSRFSWQGGRPEAIGETDREGRVAFELPGDEIATVFVVGARGVGSKTVRAGGGPEERVTLLTSGLVTRVDLGVDPGVPAFVCTDHLRLPVDADGGTWVDVAQIRWDGVGVVSGATELPRFEREVAVPVRRGDERCLVLRGGGPDPRWPEPWPCSTPPPDLPEDVYRREVERDGPVLRLVEPWPTTIPLPESHRLVALYLGAGESPPPEEGPGKAPDTRLRPPSEQQTGVALPFVALSESPDGPKRVSGLVEIRRGGAAVRDLRVEPRALREVEFVSEGVPQALVPVQAWDPAVRGTWSLLTDERGRVSVPLDADGHAWVVVGDGEWTDLPARHELAALPAGEPLGTEPWDAVATREWAEEDGRRVRPTVVDAGDEHAEFRRSPDQGMLPGWWIQSDQTLFSVAWHDVHRLLPPELSPAAPEPEQPELPPAMAGLPYRHPSLLERRSQRSVEYPAAASGLGLEGRQRCVAFVRIDPEGVPVAVEVERCPGVLHRAIEESVLQWRWAPTGSAGDLVTSLAITFDGK